VDGGRWLRLARELKKREKKGKARPSRSASVRQEVIHGFLRVAARFDDPGGVVGEFIAPCLDVSRILFDDRVRDSAHSV